MQHKQPILKRFGCLHFERMKETPAPRPMIRFLSKTCPRLSHFLGCRVCNRYTFVRKCFFQAVPPPIWDCWGRPKPRRVYFRCRERIRRTRSLCNGNIPAAGGECLAKRRDMFLRRRGPSRFVCRTFSRLLGLNSDMNLRNSRTCGRRTLLSAQTTRTNRPESR